MSKRTRLIVGATIGGLIVLIAFGLLFGNLQSQSDLQASLDDQIGIIQLARTAQAGGAQVVETQQAQLVTAQADYAAAQLSFPTDADSTEVLAQIITIAAVNRVTLRSIQAHAPTTATVGSINYLIYAYDVAADGELANVSAFLTKVESGSISTLNLDQIKIEALPTPVATLTPIPAAKAEPLPTPTLDPPWYRASFVIAVRVRLASTGVTPTASIETSTPVSQQAHLDQLKQSLDQARQQEDWAYAINLLLALKQVGPADPANDVMLVEAYLKDAQRRYSAGQFDRASADWRAALDLDPTAAEASNGLQLLEALTPTATPTITPTPSPTSTGTPTLTPTIGPTPEPYYVLNLAATANTRYPNLGCKWFGFFGRVLTTSNYPVTGITVKVWAAGFDGVKTTTSASGEYEIFLDNHPREEHWYIELRQNGESVSSIAEVDSQSDCGSNQIELDWRRGY
jgi:hypothetical protein